MKSNRPELAPDLRALLAPDEAVLWNNKEAGQQPGPGFRRIALVVVPSLAIAWLWLSSDRIGLFALAVMAVLAGTALIQAGTAIDRMFKNAIVVTSDRVIWRRCRTNNSSLWIGREYIAGATVYEGSNVVLLHGNNNQVQRLAAVDKPRDMALSLRVRTEVWFDRGDPAHGGQLSRWMIGAALGIAGSLSHEFYAVFVGDVPTIRIITFNLGGLAAAAVLFVGAHWLQARRMTVEQRRETACHLLDPLWRGRDPYTAGHIPWYEVPAVAFKLWLCRRIYGGSHDCRTGLEPLVYEPGSSILERAAQSA